MRIRLLTLAILGGLCLCPTHAEANSGTPLMWMPWFHLLFGNLVIGVGEGLLLGFLFRLDKLKAIAFMLAANYASCLAGMCTLPWIASRIEEQIPPEQLIYTVPIYLSILGAAAFILTLAVEWPFCLMLCWKRPKRIRASLAANLIAQCASYGILLYVYLSASAITLYTRVDVTPELVPSLPPSAVVHFISREGDVCRIALNGTGLVKAQRLEGDEALGNLHAGLDAARGEYRLQLKSPAGSRELPGFALPSGEWLFDDPEEPEWNRYSGDSRRVADLRPRQEREWQVWSEFWAFEGLRAQDDKRGLSLWVALEAPCIAWPARRATVLPGDLVVYQLGEQIVVLDLNRRKLGLLALGRSPVVAARIGGSP